MSEEQVLNVLRGLVIDGVDKAKSGHPGGAMSSMDFAYVLFSEFLNFDPADPSWLGRDRFVLSAGHESMLLYSLLHMMGWLELAELKRFRQLHSKTPGHPENFLTPGVECTTGPLGQGAAMSVGMAVAGLQLRAKFGAELFGHRTYALLGDGCMQEDVTLGAASLAGHLGLKNLVWFYDRNRCQISGHISRATSDKEDLVFGGFGWDTVKIDGHDRSAIRRVLGQLDKQTKPLLIIGDTTMAKGAATMEGEHETHGAPLPAKERDATKQKLGIPAGADFFVPEEAKAFFQRNFAARKTRRATWQKTYDSKIRDEAWRAQWNAHFGETKLNALPAVSWAADKPVATRNAFGDLLKAWAPHLPALIGGSADLEPSNMTDVYAKTYGDFSAENPLGRNLAFGVREFPMSSISNGIALHGGFIPFDATFLTFSDYARPALRLGAIQKCQVIHEYSHDSFYLGEDGPTHQPIEHVMSLRLIPDLYVMRPADARETQVMMHMGLELKAQSVLCLTRQKLPVLSVTEEVMQKARRGGYVLYEANFSEDSGYLFLATGSEVSLALEVAKDLEKQGKGVRVVSLPCWELFFEQTKKYQDEVLPPACQKRVSIEAGSTLGWQKFVGICGLTIGIDHFGASAPMEDLAREFGFTKEAVRAKVSSHFA